MIIIDGFEGLGKIRKMSLFSRAEKRSQSKNWCNVCGFQVSLTKLKTPSAISYFIKGMKKGEERVSKKKGKDRKREREKMCWDARK